MHWTVQPCRRHHRAPQPRDQRHLASRLQQTQYAGANWADRSVQLITVLSALEDQLGGVGEGNPTAEAITRAVRRRLKNKDWRGAASDATMFPGLGPKDTVSERENLRRQIMDELAAAGFEVRDGLIVPPVGDPKIVARQLHEPQRQAELEEARHFIVSREADLLDYFANGSEVDPRAITPAVRPVSSNLDSQLFKFASLHWSVPVSQGYGRRNRFLIWDQSNGKLIGIFALTDPVFNLGVRDRLIGWTSSSDRNACTMSSTPAYSGPSIPTGSYSAANSRHCARPPTRSSPISSPDTGTRPQSFCAGRRPHVPF